MIDHDSNKYKAANGHAGEYLAITQVQDVPDTGQAQFSPSSQPSPCSTKFYSRDQVSKYLNWLY